MYLRALFEQADEFIAVRRDIHANPELGFTEFRTSALVAERLERYGYQVHKNLGKTGVVGVLKKGNGSKSIGIRADMDALPINEANAFGHVSKNKGLMHACGHDGHTAMLLAAAKYIAESVDFNGTLNLIFQPAEEGQGGAPAMMNDGLFERFPCDAIFAMHNMPKHPLGSFALCDGAMMASSDNATITVVGNGGHGAYPHLAADPVVAAASLVMALQTVVARNVDPSQMAVVTIGALNAGQANNVIPDAAVLKLSIRALNPEVRVLLKERICAIAKAQAESYHCRADIDYKDGYPVLVNTLAETDFARQVALELVGADKVELNAKPVYGSEDFAFMLQKRPGCYLFIGNGDGKDASDCMVHNPAYDFNDANISVGSAFWCLLVKRYLA
ncbi:MAG: putative hydrolase YxeP [Pseudomonadota bacterium]|jgi:hippurate hydrolase